MRLKKGLGGRVVMDPAVMEERWLWWAIRWLPAQGASVLAWFGAAVQNAGFRISPNHLRTAHAYSVVATDELYLVSL